MSRPAARAVGPAAAQATAAVLLGQVALPVLVGDFAGSLPPESRALIWMIGGLSCSAWIVAVSPSLARGLASPLEAADAGRGAAGARLRLGEARARAIAGWVVAAGAVALVHSVLRRPITLAIDLWLPGVLAEAGIAAAALLLILFCLLLVYRASRPAIEGATWLALDAFLSTHGAAAEPMPSPSAPERGAVAQAMAEATRPAAVDAGAMLAAAGSVLPAESTVAASASESGRQPAQATPDDVTVPAGASLAAARLSTPIPPQPARSAPSLATESPRLAADDPEATQPAAPAGESPLLTESTLPAAPAAEPSSPDELTQPSPPADDSTLVAEQPGAAGDSGERQPRAPAAG